jgi:hypothetical protein
MKRKSLNLLLIVATISATVGCKKGYLDTAPSGAITPDMVYGTIAAVNSSLTATYYSTFAFAGGNGIQATIILVTKPLIWLAT